MPLRRPNVRRFRCGCLAMIRACRPPIGRMMPSPSSGPRRTTRGAPRVRAFPASDHGRGRLARHYCWCAAYVNTRSWLPRTPWLGARSRCARGGTVSANPTLLHPAQGVGLDVSWSEAVGAGVGDEVGGVVGAVPEVVAFGRAGIPPDPRGFGAVVPPAQAGEGVGVGLAGWSAFLDREVGGDVVLVAVLGGDGAAGEDAVAVAELDELASSRRVGRGSRRRRGGPCSAPVG